MQIDKETREWLEAYIENKIRISLTEKIQGNIEMKVRKFIFSKEFINEFASYFNLKFKINKNADKKGVRRKVI